VPHAGSRPVPRSRAFQPRSNRATAPPSGAEWADPPIRPAVYSR
jgi:hypothetical protein